MNGYHYLVTIFLSDHITASVNAGNSSSPFFSCSLYSLAKTAIHVTEPFVIYNALSQFRVTVV